MSATNNTYTEANGKLTQGLCSNKINLQHWRWKNKGCKTGEGSHFGFTHAVFCRVYRKSWWAVWSPVWPYLRLTHAFCPGMGIAATLALSLKLCVKTSCSWVQKKATFFFVFWAGGGMLVSNQLLSQPNKYIGVRCSCLMYGNSSHCTENFQNKIQPNLFSQGSFLIKIDIKQKWRVQTSNN